VADRFELDESDARAAGKRAQNAGERLLAAHRELVAVLDDREGCWGDDEIGKAFANKYVGMADGTRTNTEILGSNLVNTGEGIGVIAAGLADVDEDNARRIDRAYAEDVEGWSEEP
jgi:hypothetical protein